jgi:hypothetical protein
MVTKKWLTRCRFGAVVAIGFGQLIASGHSFAEPSLANLLSGKQEVDPLQKQVDQLATQLAEIERRPFAEDAEVQHALAEARAELSRARAAYSQGALETVVQRNLALVRAALSAADRLEARMFALAAFARLRQQADEMEAAARAAQAVLAQAREQAQ